MSRFESFINGLTSPVTRDGGGESAHDRRSREWRRRRKRFNSPDAVEKQGDVNRRAVVTSEIRSAVKNKGAVPKPYDTGFLRDISANAVVQAYIDTLSQDVEAANWAITARDDESDVDSHRLSQIERRYETLFPEQTAGDAHGATARILLELGDATWVKHFDDAGQFAEAVPVDSATFFKMVDSYGITEGYVQVPRTNPSAESAVDFKKREVVWFEWSNRPDRFYGQGPLEKAQNEVELLEELAEKERLDLLQGSPPGVLSPEAIDEFGGLPNAEDWDTFVDDFRLNEGERHRVGYSRIPVDFTQLTPNYQELQILDRTKFWVTVLGSVFKVNPSYAGFDFENTNRATDETQQEAYAQRGFRVTLRQLEEAINRNLIWPEFGDDVKFEFEREQTVSEKKTRADLVTSQAKAGKEMANAGLTVSYRDGLLDVEDGTMQEGNAGSSGGGGGGLFGAGGGGSSTSSSVDAAKSEDTIVKTDEEAIVLDRYLLDVHASQITPETVDDIQKAAWTGDQSVPDYVFDAIKWAIEKGGAVFRDFDSIPDDVEDEVKGLLETNLTQPQGWSLDSIVDDAQEVFPGVDKSDLETVFRTETASVLNTAREKGYEDRGNADTNDVFYWEGAEDSRITDACKELMKLTNPRHGGTPRPMDELVQLEKQVHNKYFESLDFRRHIIHPNERKTFVRDVSASTGIDINVDVPSAEEFAATQ